MPQNAALGPIRPEGESPVGEGPTDALQRVLALLACPACLQPLRATAAAVTCTGCGRIYPVIDGIPILLVDRATHPA